MIIRSIFFMLAFFAIHFLVSKNVFIKESEPLYTWQKNILIAEDYLMSDNSYDNYFLGSSLGAKITPEYLPGPDWTNLSFGGMTIFEGLELIQARNEKPKRILVEMNVIDRSPYPKLMQTVNRWPKGVVKRKIGYLTERQKPQMQIQQFAENQIVRKGLGKLEMTVRNSIDRDWQQSTTSTTTKVRELAKDKNIEFKQAGYQEYPEEQIQKHFALLKALLAGFDPEETEIIFYEFPISEELCDLPKPAYIRDQFHQHFKDSPYTFLEPVDCSEYRTSDGTHLMEDDIGKFTDWIYAQLDL